MKANPKRRLPTGLKPIEIASGNVSVFIKPERNRAGGKVYDRFTLYYWEGNERIRRRFSNLQEAKTEADLVVTKLANREGEVLKLKPEDRAIYLQSLELLRPWNIPLNLAVAEYSEARKLLPEGVALKDVVAEWVERHRQIREQRTVSALVEEFIQSKELAGNSDRHLRDLRHRLGRFAAGFALPVAQVTGDSLQRYIDALPVGNRSKLNDLRQIKTLLRWGVRRKYAPRDLLDELGAIEPPKAKPSPTLIFTPAELREILDATRLHRPDLLPAVVISAFCGLRSAEVLRLDWREIRFEQGIVEVVAAKSKTASRRTVPLCASARAWLAPFVQPEGPVCPVTGENRLHEAVLSALRRLRKARKAKMTFRWKRNGFRHSFCSYRLAETHDIGRVALEAGNSPKMIHSHYKELVSEADAQAWFGVLPPDDGKVIALPLAQAQG